MQFRHEIDLFGLARGAQVQGRDLRESDHRARDLRANLLLTQVDMFAGAVTRGGDTMRAFETLVLGLIPLVDEQTLTAVADRLGGMAETPAAVTAALAAHRTRTLDEAIRHSTLDGRRLARLVEIARRDGGIARWLLGRSEPTLLDRAVLYRFADGGERAAIRSGLASRLPPHRPAARAVDDAARATILGSRDAIGLAVRMVEFGIGPSGEAVAAALAERPAEQELYGMGLVALGFSPDECVRLVLGLPGPVPRSTAAVHRIAGIVRLTNPAVASRLADPDDRLGAAAGRPGHGPFEASHLAARAPGVRVTAADRARRRPEASALPDRRSRSTTGPGRT